MSGKKKSVVISYAGTRLLLETIVGYVGVYLDASSKATRYGIKFYIRSGEIIEALGDDKLSRNNLLEFLDKHFDAVHFEAYMCNVCIHEEARDDCYQNRDQCGHWGNRQHFKRKESDA